MAELLKRANDLLALKVGLDPASDPTSRRPLVVLEVQRGGKTAARETATPDELGIPPDLSPKRWAYRDPPFTLPPGLLDRLEAAVARERTDADSLLWLHVGSPAGYLALVPWELLLRRRFAQPVVRVPNFALNPARDTDELDVVVCVSRPEAKAPFDSAGHAVAVIEAFRRGVELPASIHLFADRETYADLRHHWPAHGPGRVAVHDPEQAPPPLRGGPDFDDPGEIVNPWLHWIAHEMAGRTVELVHLVVHGYLDRNRPALAFAESPTTNRDRSWSRFVGPRQMAAFLGAVGGWAFGLSSPRYDYSPMGSRQFTDDLARERAGPILLHPFKVDEEAAALASTFRAIFTGSSPADPSAITMYCHPQLFGAPSDEVSSLAESVVRGSSWQPAPEGGAPAWAVLTRRQLEQSVATLLPGTSEANAVDRATGAGAQEALDFVSSVIGATSAAGRPLVAGPDALAERRGEETAS